MYKLLILLFLFFSLLSKAQEKISYQQVDSLTYNYFLKGEWDNLVNISQNAIKQGIEFKYLYQRTGYAHFMRADYFACQAMYEKALKFDQSDPITLEYLYYCGLNTGSEGYSRYYAKELDVGLQKRLGIKNIIPVEQIDLEYNFKTNDATTRSDPYFYRLGIKTLLGYRLSLYQSVSYFGQTIDGSKIKQPEYFALLRWSVTPKIQVKCAFHGTNTKISNYNYPAYLGFLALSSQIKRLNIEGNISVLALETTNVAQLGLQAGVVLPGRSFLYFTSSLDEMIEEGSARTVFSQSVGLKCLKNLWAEGNVTLGNLKNYRALNCQYIYNTLDPTFFRMGLAFFYNLDHHFALIGDFTYDQKEFGASSNNKQHYNQLSLSGGIKWKL